MLSKPHRKGSQASLSTCQCLQMKTSRTFLRECSVVSPLVLLLFGGTLQIQYAEGFTLVDGWLRVRTAPQTAVLVKQVCLKHMKTRVVAACVHDSQPQTAGLCRAGHAFDFAQWLVWNVTLIAEVVPLYQV